ncbi:hypothetical protein [Francisella philomiragia]|uniref:Lipoprotein n=1 Tax=Francisella philomiragia TaxID=28110 RepID=A0ABS1GEG9_9GAMM|nr:hypothetical protein [Francisella philomiragia]MBK2259553.1 hypothetical protein [Francisella philomiragia]MBK2266504.1 hypothetical protein [Francisella philomiragia]MBK2278328.1 hypothetical protein [Francisella philomiragia]MBK2286184.1 hypothetical protein [Francisella philomiragia]MBK2287787.1 hypothetical protein [Francisella philomiragia]
MKKIITLIVLSVFLIACSNEKCNKAVENSPNKTSLIQFVVMKDMCDSKFNMNMPVINIIKESVNDGDKNLSYCSDKDLLKAVRSLDEYKSLYKQGTDRLNNGMVFGFENMCKSMNQMASSGNFR